MLFWFEFCCLDFKKSAACKIQYTRKKLRSISSILPKYTALEQTLQKNISSSTDLALVVDISFHWQRFSGHSTKAWRPLKIMVLSHVYAPSSLLLCPSPRLGFPFRMFAFLAAQNFPYWDGNETALRLKKGPLSLPTTIF